MPEGLLILCCGHNLCLQCASANLRKERLKQGTSHKPVLGSYVPHSIVCELCGSTTELEPASASELAIQSTSLEVPQVDSLPPVRDQRLQQLMRSQSHLREEEVNTRRSPLASPQSPFALPETERTYCQLHEEEEAKYFCFDCLTPPVCSECVLGGVHKAHDVMHVKKAFVLVANKLESLLHGMVNSIDELSIDRKSLEARKAGLQDQAESLKAQVRGLIDELHARLTKKGRELEAVIDAALEDGFHEFDSQVLVLQTRSNILATHVQAIREHTSAGLGPALSFYAESHKFLSQLLSEHSKPRPQFDDLARPVSLPVTMASMAKFKENVGNIGEAITELKVVGNYKEEPSVETAETTKKRNRGQRLISTIETKLAHWREGYS